MFWLALMFRLALTLAVRFAPAPAFTLDRAAPREALPPPRRWANAGDPANTSARATAIGCEMGFVMMDLLALRAGTARQGLFDRDPVCVPRGNEREGAGVVRRREIPRVDGGVLG